MTKADIIESLYAQVKLSKKESTEIVELVIESMKSTLERGEDVKISGFGIFHVKAKERRVGRNPQTGTELEISARLVPSFRPSQVLKDEINATPVAADPKRAGKTNGRLP